MNRKLIILGASGHGKVIADIAALNAYSEIVFLDDDDAVKTCAGYPVQGKISLADDMDGDICVAIGNAAIRRRLMDLYSGRKMPALIHPQSTVANGVKIGEGSVVMAGAVINPDAVIGRGCIINTCSSVDHDCCVDDFAHISVGSHLCGTVTIGANTWVGAGAVVKNNITICSDCVIGAGAVVVRDIVEPGTYIGVPAGRI